MTLKVRLKSMRLKVSPPTLTIIRLNGRRQVHIRLTGDVVGVRGNAWVEYFKSKEEFYQDGCKNETLKSIRVQL